MNETTARIRWEPGAEASIPATSGGVTASPAVESRREGIEQRCLAPR